MAIKVPKSLKTIKLTKILRVYCFNALENTGKYGPEKTPYLDTFHAVTSLVNMKRSAVSHGFVHIY